MEFLEVAGKTIQRASIEDEDLAVEPADFKGGFDYHYARLGPGDQSRAVGAGTLKKTVVSGVDFSGGRLDPVELVDVRFEDVAFANAAVTAGIALRTEVLRCQAIGLALEVFEAADVYADDCRFDYAAIRFEKVKTAVVFRRCTFREGVLSGDLSNVVFDDCDLFGTEFSATRATGCDLTRSRLAGVRGLLTLRGAKIHGTQADSLGGQFASEAGLTVIP